ncbi:MAG TPA: AI-2E family transporter, partial [Lacipirellulaceae bacterium]|nr:AI-2E family transporter [Lacipirellulaceae bacterium]
DVMIPFVLSIFVTAAVSPMVDYQVRRWRIPTLIAVLTTLLLVFAMMTLLGTILVVAVQTMVHAASEYGAQVNSLITGMFKELNTYLANSKLVHLQVDEQRVSAELQSYLPDVITQTAGTVTTLVSHGLLILFFVVFLLLGRNPHQRRKDIYSEIEKTFRGYITTMTALAAVTALLVGFVLWALGLHMAWLFAFIVFLLSFIPSIGPIIATLLPVPVAVTQFHDPWTIAAVVLIPGAIHMVIGNIIEPKLMGRGLELHPVTVLLALAFWGLLWGVIGMVLAVPIVAMLRIVFSHFSTTRSLADLLAGHLPGTNPAVSIEV